MNKLRLLAIVVLCLVAMILTNLRSLYEGIFFYLRDTIEYNPTPAYPIRRDGRYASLYDLVSIPNAARRAYILNYLNSLGLSVAEIPIPDSSLTNIFVTFNSVGPYTIFSAHYDKLFDEVGYQGASDNTAADSTLLASISELVRRGYRGKAAFLFTCEEEKGMRGSRAFVTFAHDTKSSLQIKENINFDNIGRGKLGIRPSASVPGFAFSVPFLGDYAYDGREFRPSPLYPPTPLRLVQALLLAQPQTTVYERFTALSDSNIFQANNIDTVAISGDDMRFLELTWHTFADRVELLDERNLDLAFDLILHYAPEN